MRTWQVALLGGALLAVAGCRTDPAIPLLERQLRQQEDEIYRLRAQLEGCQDGACEHRTEHAARSERDYDREEAEPRHRPGASAPTAKRGLRWTLKSPDSPPKRFPTP